MACFAVSFVASLGVAAADAMKLTSVGGAPVTNIRNVWPYQA